MRAQLTGNTRVKNTVWAENKYRILFMQNREDLILMTFFFLLDQME